MKRLLYILCVLVFAWGCESLEETYDEMAGDGKIRYIGMCKDLEVVPGWERLSVSWENQVDPVITNIEVAWMVEGVRHDTLLPRSATKCDIRNLSQDGTYQIFVSSVDKSGNKSIEISTYARPYTSNHEILNTFSRVVVKHFFIRDRLVLFFDRWNERLESAKLEFTAADGSLKTLDLTESIVGKSYYLLPEAIDPAQPVMVKRKGYIDDSEDLILFKPIELRHDYLFTTDFKRILQYNYGLSEIGNAFVESLEELEIDYSLSSFEDLLYFPNLKKLHLGKNRFMYDTYVAKYGNDSKVIDDPDLKETKFILDVAHELNGLTVERYNEHFIPRVQASKFPYLTAMGNPTVPERTFIPSKEFSIKCVPEDASDYDSHLEHLFDRDVNTTWETAQQGNPRRYVITVDFRSPRNVNGVQVVQRVFNPSLSSNYLKLMPQMMVVEGSTNGVTWKDMTYLTDNTLGATVGETTDLKFRENAGEVRFIRFAVSDLPLGANYCIMLSELGLY